LPKKKKKPRKPKKPRVRRRVKSKKHRDALCRAFGLNDDGVPIEIYTAKDGGMMVKCSACGAGILVDSADDILTHVAEYVVDRVTQETTKIYVKCSEACGKIITRRLEAYHEATGGQHIWQKGRKIK
jgi:hypothetical protein